MNFDEELKKRRDRADAVLERYLPAEDAVPGKLAEAMNYSIRSGGKRIRPILMMESYRMFGGRKTVVEPFMAAIEMIHTHSLVHDDLPAVDNDELRRGRKTTHAVFGEAIGILAGDALLNYAYETALQAFRQTEDAQLVVEALEILARETGLYGMLGGQSVDVENDKNGICALSKEKLDYIYLHKTGALLEAPLMIGAVLAGADREETESMKEIGRRIGLAFQIQDDILDVTSTLEVLGKPIGSDGRNEKSTYVTFEGIEQAKKDVERLSEEAVSILEQCSGDHAFLKELFLFLIDRKK